MFPARPGSPRNGERSAPPLRHSLALIPE